MAFTCTNMSHFFLFNQQLQENVGVDNSNRTKVMNLSPMNLCPFHYDYLVIDSFKHYVSVYFMMYSKEKHRFVVVALNC